MFFFVTVGDESPPTREGGAKDPVVCSRLFHASKSVRDDHQQRSDEDREGLPLLPLSSEKKRREGKKRGRRDPESLEGIEGTNTVPSTDCEQGSNTYSGITLLVLCSISSLCVFFDFSSVCFTLFCNSHSLSLFPLGFLCFLFFSLFVICV